MGAPLPPARRLLLLLLLLLGGRDIGAERPGRDKYSLQVPASLAARAPGAAADPEGAAASVANAAAAANAAASAEPVVDEAASNTAAISDEADGEGTVEQDLCCEAQTADCYACREGKEVTVYCAEKPHMQGCPEADEHEEVAEADQDNAVVFAEDKAEPEAACGGEALEGDGVTYRGCQARTVSGYQCRNWKDTGLTGDGLGDHSYCRNPNPESTSTIWCHYIDPGSPTDMHPWEICVPLDEAAANTTLASSPQDEADSVPEELVAATNGKPEGDEREADKLDEESEGASLLAQASNKNGTLGKDEEEEHEDEHEYQEGPDEDDSEYDHVADGAGEPADEDIMAASTVP